MGLTINVARDATRLPWPLPVHALNPLGPAVDAVPLGSGCALPSFDEHNQPRPLDGNLDGAFACDIGAVESSVR